MLTLSWMAWRNVRRNRRRTLITVAAVSLGLTLMVFMNGLIVGSSVDILHNIVRLGDGHLALQAKGEKERSWIARFDDREASELVSQLQMMPLVKAVSPRLRFFGLLASKKASENVEIRGIDPNLDRDINTFVFQASSPYLDEADRDQILIGSSLSQKLEVEVGARLNLFLFQSDGKTSVIPLTVKSVYDTGFSEYDKTHAFVTLKLAQKLLFRGITDVAIILEDPEQADSLAQHLASLDYISTPYEAITWQKSNQALLDTLAAKDYFMALLGAIIVLIAAFGVLNTMLMSVYERTREIGVIMALGMKARDILALFLFEGLYVGIMGGLLGSLLGFALTKYYEINGLTLYGEASQISNIPIGNTIYPTVEFRAMLIYFLFICGISLLASLYPAFMAARRQPAEALRFT